MARRHGAQRYASLALPGRGRLGRRKPDRKTGKSHAAATFSLAAVKTLRPKFYPNQLAAPEFAN